MNLMLHIFRKDARHLYPEILITLALTLLFAWSAPSWWSPPTGWGTAMSPVLAAALRFFLPLIWIILITRLVQDESLVGDRQFWITRPYTWPILLGAKVLFLGVFVYLPLFLMQCYLLHHAGMSVAAALPDLLLYHLRLTVIGVLPVFALATVTATFARHFLTILGGLVYLLLAGAAVSSLTGDRMMAPGIPLACLVLAAALFLAVVLLQYTSRRTGTARLVLLALPVVLAIVTLAAPTKMLVEHIFPASFTASRLRFDKNPARQPGEGKLFLMGSNVVLALPIDPASLPAGTRLKARGAALDLETPDGFHWSSPYRSTGDDLDVRNSQPSLRVTMPLAVFNRIRSTPVDLRISLAVVKYGTAAFQTMQAHPPGFTTPGSGFCPMDGVNSPQSCIYPLRQPPPMDLSAQVSSAVCEETTGAPSSVVNTALGSDEETLTFDFDPVSTQTFSLYLPQTQNSPFRPVFLCPGAQVTLTPHFMEGRERVSFSETGLILAPYAVTKGPSASVTGEEQ